MNSEQFARLLIQARFTDLQQGVKSSFDTAAYLMMQGKPKTGTMPSTAEKLLLYGLFNQATNGDVTEAQPSAFKLDARAKWDAWRAQKGKSNMQAMQDYVAEADRLKVQFQIEAPDTKSQTS